MTISFTPFPILETERLVLRQLQMSDKQSIFLLRSDERINEFIDRENAISIDEAANFIDMMEKTVANNEGIYWVLEDKSSNCFIGTACLWGVIDEDAKAEIGYELLYEAQGKGYMQEAVSAVVEYGFKTMGLKTISAVIKEGNERSVKLAESKGFKFIKKEGVELFYVLESGK
jgi:ribosomal-protein-alanine N-acetyltransferase